MKGESPDDQPHLVWNLSLIGYPATNDPLPPSRLSIESLYSESQLVAGRLNILRLKTLERGDVDVRDEGVELVRRVLILVPEAGQANTDAVGNISATVK